MSDLLPLPSPPPPDPPSTAINGASLPSDPTAAATTSTTTTKRHRRPSVRLGDLTSSDVPLFRRLPKLPPLKTNPKTNPNPNRSRSKRPRPSSWTSKPAEDVDDDGFRSEFDRQSQSPSPSGDRENGVHEVGVEEDDDDDVVVGVRSWLNRLGLGRYAPVFEIHEVDDEVLPLLTLEDLKDMGISAVGSRRKMFSEIQKLGNKNHNNF